MFSIVKAREVRNFSCLCQHACARLTFKFTLSAKLCVSSLINDLLNINEYFCFVS